LEKLQFIINNAPVSITAERTSEGLTLAVSADDSYDLSDIRTNDSVVTFNATVAGSNRAMRPSRRLEIPYAVVGDAIVFSWQGNTYRFIKNRGGAAASSASESSGSIAAPTGGVVAELLVAVGQEVELYQPVAVVEAMKVMTPVDSPVAGLVAELFVERGQRVEQGTILARIEPNESKS
jgi:biotin carboxyl carrier protein